MPIKQEKPNLNQFHRPMTRKMFDAAMYELFGTLDPKEIKMFSTNFNRSMVSAECQLLGLYSNISYNDIHFYDFNGTNVNTEPEKT